MARRRTELETLTTIIELTAIALVAAFFWIAYPPGLLLVSAAVLLAVSYRITRSHT